MKTETINYKGYELQAVHNPPFWQVGVYPTSPNCWRRAQNFRLFLSPTKTRP